MVSSIVRLRSARSHRRLLVMVLLIVAVIGGFFLFSRNVRPYLLPPATIAYYQYRGPDPCREYYCTTWARLNHTIVVDGTQVNSFVTVTMAEEPPESGVFINISFDGGEPVLMEGTTQWTGEPHQGDAITVYTSISLPKDGTYFIWANPYSDSLGLVSVYQLRVKSGIIIDVSNASFENPGTPLEHRCLANCRP